MTISSIISLGTEALFLAVIAVVIFAAIWLLGYKLIYKKKMNGKKEISLGKMAWVCILAVYVIVVLLVTLARPGMGGVYEGSANWKPFSSYKEAWYNFSAREWRNLILNICMFVPLGFLLPICFGKIDRAWKTYLCGFAFTLFIELVQLVTGRGVFEADDIINNTVGAMIGYGLFSAVRLIFAAFGARRKIHNDANNINSGNENAGNTSAWDMQNTSLRRCLPAQLPLVFTVIAFVVIFAVYSSREYGNLSINNTSKYNVDVSMADGVNLSDKAERLDVYTIHTATKDEARELAEEYFSKYDVSIDDSRTDVYDDTIVFYSTSLDDEGNNLSIWCDYEGPTVNFTDFSKMDDDDSADDNTIDNSALSEEFVREKLENLGVFIPQNAVFAPEEEYDAGNYKFTDEGEVLDDGLYYKGTIECRIASSGEVENFRDSMIKYTPYKKVDVISEKEAYDKLCTGRFYFYNYDYGKNEKLSELTVKSVQVSYIADSKGYYRPVYEFVASVGNGTGDSDISIMIDAMKN